MEMDLEVRLEEMEFMTHLTKTQQKNLIDLSFEKSDQFRVTAKSAVHKMNITDRNILRGMLDACDSGAIGYQAGYFQAISDFTTNQDLLGKE